MLFAATRTGSGRHNPQSFFLSYVFTFLRGCGHTGASGALSRCGHAGHGRGRLWHRHGRVRHHGFAARGGQGPASEHCAGGARHQRVCGGRDGGRAGAGGADGQMAAALAAGGDDAGVRAGQFRQCARAGVSVPDSAALCGRAAARHVLWRGGSGGGRAGAAGAAGHVRGAGDDGADGGHRGWRAAGHLGGRVFRLARRFRAGGLQCAGGCVADPAPRARAVRSGARQRAG